jgi:hypothetical protein
MFLGESLSRRERVARVSGPGYRKLFFDILRIFFIAVPLTRRFAAPFPFRRGICKPRFAGHGVIAS